MTDVAPVVCVCLVDVPEPTARPCPVSPIWMCLPEVDTDPPEANECPGTPFVTGGVPPGAHLPPRHCSPIGQGVASAQGT